MSHASIPPQVAKNSGREKRLFVSVSLRMRETGAHASHGSKLVALCSHGSKVAWLFRCQAGRKLLAQMDPERKTKAVKDLR